MLGLHLLENRHQDHVLEHIAVITGVVLMLVVGSHDGYLSLSVTLTTSPSMR
jgi:hypothetical protein